MRDEPTLTATSAATSAPTTPDSTSPRPSRLLLVASTGGHLTQLVAMRGWWEQFDRAWVTFDNPHASSALVGEDVIHAHSPTTRNIPNALRNLRLARRVLSEHGPDLVISTGAGVAAPFFAVAHLRGIRTMYIEVIDRITTRTLTGRMVYPFVDRFAVQWPEQQRLYPGAAVIGPTI
ncbi:MAG: UDP-N-acetylglucosamine--LPS N-acetylglucosamine transferase [Brachybacterium sp.]|nr:UDP-N-acetylglucosamine--LPS N-acetylglucosamine transferase [Brachybacterium sp.]MDN6329965.1 UDP-N-acetylglucosamine--LPS N-acetylglucosamine transferase [Brachybacterium sp.]